MVRKSICYLVFVLVESLIILGSIVGIVGCFLPFVALKALFLLASGRIPLPVQPPVAARPAPATASSSPKLAA